MADVADDDVFQGRVETTIKLRIGEAKNLPPSSHGGSRDCYVVVALDQEEIFRTATTEKTLNPFFGEEFSFRVPRDFRLLSFYICESNLFSFTGDTRLGKVALKCRELGESPAWDDRWYPILPILPDSEVQGKVHMSINLLERLVDVDKTQFVLCVRVLECCGLSVWGAGGLADPFCQVNLISPQGQVVESKRGQARRKTVDPYFNDVFEFNVGYEKHLSSMFVCVSVRHQALLSESIFLGQVNISLSSLSSFHAHTGWYLLCPRPEALQQKAGSGGVAKQELGSLRVNVRYMVDCVYPLKVYQPLANLLEESLAVEPITDSAVFVLSEVHKDRSAMGRALVKIFLKLGRLEDLFQRLIDHEVGVTSDPNTLFRGNSLTSKVIDEFMKMVGASYLQRTLQHCLDEIFESRRPCEVDAARLAEGDNIDVNMANLLFFVEKILSAIVASARSCPRSMCRLFSRLREAAVRKFPECADMVQFTAVSGFIFLRFFAPAILNPKLFRLRPENASPVVARTLTLISKTIQNMGNFGGKRRSRVTYKEDFMAPVNFELMDDGHIKDLKDYLTAISDHRGGEECSEDMVYREGYLVKRSQGRHKGPKNFRKRYFCLSDQGISYAKMKGESPLNFIPTSDLLAVERVDDNAFGMKFMFQLIQPKRVLYMQAKNSVDLMEWLSALAKACPSTAGVVELFHSGAFANGAWTCCNDVVEGAPMVQGCMPISLAIQMLGRHEDIDLEKELHNIYRMFLDGQTAILRLKDESTAQARGQSSRSSSPTCTLAIPPRLSMLCELLVFVKNLELTSSTQLATQAERRGSKSAPYSCESCEAHELV